MGRSSKDAGEKNASPEHAAAPSDPIAGVNKRVEEAASARAKRKTRPFPACSFEEALEFAKRGHSPRRAARVAWRCELALKLVGRVGER